MSNIGALIGVLLLASPAWAEEANVKVCGKNWPPDTTKVLCEGSPYSSTLKDGRLPDELAHLAQLEILELRRLSLKDCTVLQRLPSLRELTFAHTRVLNAECLAVPPSVERLELREAKVDNISGLKSKGGLLHLSLPADVTDIKPVAAISTLESLDLRDTRVADLSPLSNLVNLKRLLLSGASGVRDGVPLKGLVALEHLDLTSTGLEDVKWAKRLVLLKTLLLGDTAIKDLRGLKRLEALLTLNLAGTPLKRLPSLKRLTQLHTLILSDTFVSKVTTLRRQESLRQLDLVGTEVSEKQLEKLKEALPECKIAH